MTNSKTNWITAIAIPIVVAVLGASGIVTILVGVFLKPDIFAEVIPDEKVLHKAQINVINKGNAPAKNMEVTVETQHNISNHSIFSTENYTEKYKENSTTLKVFVPRFTQGDGSMLRIDTLTNPQPNVTSDDYTVYATHDQGSTRLLANLVQTPLNPPMAIGQQSNEFWNTYGFSITTLAAAILIPVIMQIVRGALKP